MAQRIRIGVDLGGTRIKGLALDPAGAELARLRSQHTPDPTRRIVSRVIPVGRRKSQFD